jgi:hypothetical protein
MDSVVHKGDLHLPKITNDSRLAPERDKRSKNERRRR